MKNHQNIRQVAAVWIAMTLLNVEAYGQSSGKITVINKCSGGKTVELKSFDDFSLYNMGCELPPPNCSAGTGAMAYVMTLDSQASQAFESCNKSSSETCWNMLQAMNSIMTFISNKCTLPKSQEISAGHTAYFMAPQETSMPLNSTMQQSLQILGIENVTSLDLNCVYEIDVTDNQSPNVLIAPGATVILEDFKGVCAIHSVGY